MTCVSWIPDSNDRLVSGEGEGSRGRGKCEDEGCGGQVFYVWVQGAHSLKMRESYEASMRVIQHGFID